MLSRILPHPSFFTRTNDKHPRFSGLRESVLGGLPAGEILMGRLDREAVRCANPIEEVIREDAGGLLGESNGEQKFRCRYHGDGEDTHPSGSVNPSKGEYFCHVCNSGGDVFDWVQRESNLTFPEALQRLARRAGIDEDESSSAVTGEWVYRDSEGRPVNRVQRFDPPSGKKKFSQQQSDGNGGWIGGKGAMENVLRQLYRRNELKGHRTVYVVEGEKCAGRMWDAGFPATT